MSDDPEPSTRVVSCSFYDPAQCLVVEANVKASTTLGPTEAALREAACKHAVSKGFPTFVTPSAAGQWFTFEVRNNMAHFHRAWPSKDAAEMWMQHHGG